MEEYKRQILKFLALLTFFFGTGPFSEMARKAFLEKAKVKLKRAVEKVEKSIP